MGDVIAELVVDHGTPFVQILSKKDYEADLNSEEKGSTAGKTIGDAVLVLELEGPVSMPAQRLLELVEEADIRASPELDKQGALPQYLDLLFSRQYAEGKELERLTGVIRKLGGEDVTARYFSRE